MLVDSLLTPTNAFAFATYSTQDVHTWPVSTEQRIHFRIGAAA